jgi:hypothetical protein
MEGLSFVSLHASAPCRVIQRQRVQDALAARAMSLRVFIALSVALSRVR